MPHAPMSAWVDTGYPAVSIASLALQTFNLPPGHYRFNPTTPEAGTVAIRAAGNNVRLDVADPVP